MMRKVISLFLCLVLCFSLFACDDEVVQGPQGATGAQGPQGEKGDTGATGPEGPKGDTGATGPQGEKGETGPEGPKGENGTDGKDGITPTFQIDGGELMVSYDNGLTWSFLGYIQGADGKDGEQGPQGEKGDQGEQGIQGEKGDKGDTGAAGVGIASVTVNADGKLIITLTDGTVLDPIDIPRQELHQHTLGAWNDYNGNSEMQFAICTNCKEIVWQFGSCQTHTFTTVTTPPTCVAQGYDTKTCSVCGLVEVVNHTPVVDHTFSDSYSCNNSFHWYDCTSCDATSGYGEHTIGDDGFCTVCNQPLAPTEGIVYDVSGDGTYAEVIGYSGTAARIVIADTYQGLPVKTIYEYAFCQNTKITSVTIPNGVTSIGYYAFYACSSLTSVTIPDSVTTIGERAFFDCSRLTSVNITNIAAWCQIYFVNFYSSPLYYAENLYLNGTLVTDLVIPDGVTSIGSYAFQHCNNLTSVVIPDSVTTIGSSAFQSCSSLTSLTIGNSVTTIGSSAFQSCNLTSVTMAEGCAPTIGQDAFSYCHSSLYTEYAYGKYVGVNGNPYAILVELTNQYMSTYEIHEEARFICGGVFSGCTRLASVNVTDIAVWCQINFGNSYSNPLYYAENLYISGSLVTDLVIPDGVTDIGKYAFYGCDSLTSVTIPSSVQNIGTSAFSGCSKLATVTFAEDSQVSTIGDYAFSSCDSLTSVTIPDSITTIGDYAFHYCNNLTSVTFENTEGWWVSRDANATSGTALSAKSLASTSIAAQYLQWTYCHYYWHREATAV